VNFFDWNDPDCSSIIGLIFNKKASYEGAVLENI